MAYRSRTVVIERHGLGANDAATASEFAPEQSELVAVQHRLSSFLGERCSPTGALGRSMGSILQCLQWGLGGVQDMESKRQAETAALAACKARGGRDCRVNIVYYNQCGAVASGGGHMGSARAPTEKEAVEDAIATCEESGGSDCQLYFMGCSYPVRVN